MITFVKFCCHSLLLFSFNIWKLVAGATSDLRCQLFLPLFLYFNWRILERGKSSLLAKLVPNKRCHSSSWRMTFLRSSLWPVRGKSSGGRKDFKKAICTECYQMLLLFSVFEWNEGIAFLELTYEPRASLEIYFLNGLIVKGFQYSSLSIRWQQAKLVNTNKICNGEMKI